MRGFQLLALLLLSIAARAQEQRAFSLFNLVKFKKETCQATTSKNGGSYSGLTGTCMSSSECSEKKGEHKGNCANGFGVCCLQQLKACGGTVSNNNTYLANVGYPTVLASGVNSCAYTIKREGGNKICQIRLDFDDFVLVTGTSGAIGTTQSRMAAVGGSGIEPSTISGTNTGDHMYVECEAQDPVVTFTTITGETTNKWNVRVTQIACDSEWKAPKDCTQFFTTDNGIIRSYNTRGTTMQELVSQDVNICIRQNMGKSGAFLKATTFQVGVTTATAARDATCAALNGALLISDPDGGLFCHGVFSPVAAQTTASVVTLKNGPIRIKHFHTGTVTAGTKGFVINYSQT